ncbi:ABC transporter ATP-binding protein [Candidatus Pelagibacter sp. HIMB1485]|uniref:ABC transporter ATP-binding protein n=1 Tax=Candidatus Pelagibacter sp. HIMB1485 TaxID=3415415 RepID=UPI003F87FF8A
MQTVKKILFLLTSSEIKKAILLLIMILVMALLDMLGVASILPFMAVLSSPEIIETNMIYNEMFEISKNFGVENARHFIFGLGVLLFILLVTSISFKALTLYVQVRFVQMRQYSLSKRLVERYLNQPYSWFLNRNSAELGKTILTEVNQVIGSGVRPLLDLIAGIFVTIAIVALLVITNTKISMIIGFSLILAYAIVLMISRKYLHKFGDQRLKANELRFISVSEAFGAAKEIKIGGLEKIYLKRFSDPAHIFARAITKASIFAEFPRFVFEIIAFGGILLVTLYLMTQTGNFSDVLPILSLFVFAGYRLMPALQKIYASIATLTYIGPSLDKLYADIKTLKKTDQHQYQNTLSINKSITLKNIHFNYPNTTRTALKNINISIPVKSTVALVGATGSGKTTIVDIILGLLEAQKGNLEVDSQIITKQNLRAWQQSIGYVPQNIFLADDTIAANIALGVETKDINQLALEKASKIANLHEFVVNELPNKYQTSVGERGVRLSGGQRQRIGIARALYHDPQVLILDEATSALDNQTEKAVMDAVNNIKKDITIILIAHRLNTVKNCDIIFKIDKGQLISEGTYKDLIYPVENSNTII